MNGRIAKQLRKKFGYKPYAPREYSGNGTHSKPHHKLMKYVSVTDTIVNIGKRQQYQDAKKDYKAGTP